MKKRTSARGLIKITTLEGDDSGAGDHVSFEPDGTIRGPNAAVELAELIRHLRTIAIDSIVEAGGDPKKTMRKKDDPKVLTVEDLARKILIKLNRAQWYAAKGDTLQGMVEMARTAVLIRALTTVETEPGVMGRVDRLNAIGQGPAARRKRLARNVEMARGYEKLRADEPSLSATAAMKKIGKEYGLGRSQSHAAVKVGLKELKRG
jgi:hypothetical protein